MPVNSQVNQRFRSDQYRERRNPTVPVVQGRGVSANPLTSRVEYDGADGSGEMLTGFLSKFASGSGQIAAAITHLGESEYEQARQRAESGNFEVDDNGFFRCVGAQSRAISEVKGANAAAEKANELSAWISKRGEELRREGKSEAEQNATLNKEALEWAKTLLPDTKDKDFLESYGRRLFDDARRLLGENMKSNVARQLAREQSEAGMAHRSDFARIMSQPETQREALRTQFPEMYRRLSVATGIQDPAKQPEVGRMIKELVRDGRRDLLLELRDAPLFLHKDSEGNETPYTLGKAGLISDDLLHEADENDRREVENQLKKDAALSHQAARTVEKTGMAARALIDELPTLVADPEKLEAKRSEIREQLALYDKILTDNTGNLTAAQRTQADNLRSTLSSLLASNGQRQMASDALIAEAEALSAAGNREGLYQFLIDHVDKDFPDKFAGDVAAARSPNTKDRLARDSDLREISRLTGMVELSGVSPDAQGALNTPGSSTYKLTESSIGKRLNAKLAELRRVNPEASREEIYGKLEEALTTMKDEHGQPYRKKAPGSSTTLFEEAASHTGNTPTFSLVDGFRRAKDQGKLEEALAHWNAPVQDKELMRAVMASPVGTGILVDRLAEAPRVAYPDAEFGNGFVEKEKAFTAVRLADGSVQVKPLRDLQAGEAQLIPSFDAEKYPELLAVADEKTLRDLARPTPTRVPTATPFNSRATGTGGGWLPGVAENVGERAFYMPDRTSIDLPLEDHWVLFEDPTGRRKLMSQKEALTAPDGTHLWMPVSKPFNPHDYFIRADGVIISAVDSYTGIGTQIDLHSNKRLQDIGGEESIKMYRLLPPRVKAEWEKKGGYAVWRSTWPNLD